MAGVPPFDGGVAADRTVLVTGVAGFIGSHLAAGLLDRGYAVRGIDNFATGQRRNLDGFVDNPHFHFFEGDIRDDTLLAEAADGVTYVFHQAAVPSVPRSVEDPKTTVAANCTGTAAVVAAARDAGVEGLVVASSSSVYGSDTGLPKVETMTPAPESPYALSKYATETLALQAADLYDVEAVALRYFNVFGPRQDPDGEYAAVIPKFIARMLAGESPPIYGDGEQSRDFTYVENVVEANVRAAEGDVSGVVCNVGCGERTSINALVDQINGLLGTNIEPRYESPRPGDVRHSCADVTRAGEEIDYDPEVGLEEGLARTIDHVARQRTGHEAGINRSGGLQ